MIYVIDAGYVPVLPKGSDFLERGTRPNLITILTNSNLNFQYVSLLTFHSSVINDVNYKH